jgi:hypothetical protein
MLRIAGIVKIRCELKSLAMTLAMTLLFGAPPVAHGLEYLSEGHRPEDPRCAGPRFDLQSIGITLDRVVVFGQAQFGKFPKLEDCNSDGNCQTVIYGGVPQNITQDMLRDHLRAVEANIQQRIPDPNFSGHAVIDYEAW